MSVTGFLEQHQKQELRQNISVQQIQYVTLLQMNIQELNERLNELEAENPLIDVLTPEPGATQEEAGPLAAAQWLVSKPVLRPDEDPDDFNADGRQEPSLQNDDPYDLQAYLRNQFDFSLTRVELSILEKLIYSLDENGYLAITAEQAAQTFNVDLVLAQEAIGYLKSLDPPGIAAKNLAETLTIQLERRGINDPLAYRLVEDYLQELPRGHFQKIAGALGCSAQKVRDLYALIQTLQPRPAYCFGSRPAVYILPDVTVTEKDGVLSCSYNDRYSAHINVNRSYLSLCDKGDEVKDYVERKLSQAMWVAKAIKTRRDTIEQIAEAIVHRQRDFFLQGGDILPLRLQDIANELNVHESTVSRSVNGKYIECKYGVFPFKHFFSRALPDDAGGQSAGSRSVKDQIKNLIEAEDPRRPLSDSALVTLLEKDKTI
ncbi:MAG TPA: RNA polymerase factor sigma-54, partial [Clostridia bacterium]|nr:RNA polymerase factor sigma-54 [Clostridia bacterium]